jgi:hypothetical protein
MDPNLGDGLATLFLMMALVLAIAVPLGLWKLIDIAIWLCHHVV